MGVTMNENENFASLANSREQNPSWEVISCSASQDTACLLWDRNVHYHVHRNSPQVPILNQMNLIHTHPPYFYNIHSNINLPSMSRSSKWSVPFRFPNQKYVCTSHLFQMCCMPHHPHSPWSDNTNTWWRVTWWSFSLYNFLQPPITSSILGLDMEG